METSFRKARAPLALVAGILLCASSGVLAAQWKTVRIAPDKTTYLDVNGVARNGEAVQAWELEKFSADQSSRAWEGKYRSVKSLTGYDCLKRTTEPLLRVYLGADGAELKRVQMQGLQFPAAVEPDSLREKMLELACVDKDKGNKDQAQKDQAQKDKTEKVAARPEEKKPGLVAEAAAAEMPKESPAPAKAAEASHAKAKPEAGATDAKAKAGEKDKPADNLAKVAPTKVALLTKAPEAKPAIEAPKPAAAAPAKPVRRPATSRVALRRERARPAACLAVEAHKPVAACRSSEVRKPGTHEAHWSYLGETGADRWGAIDPGYAACAEGRQQSPIDIRDGARLELEPIEFSYTPGPLRVVDNGHTVQVNIEAGRYIVVLGRRYDLKQFHFHKPAEERIDGRSYDMVAHLVHKDPDGRIAVVAVLFEAGVENAFIRKLWPYLPLEQGIETYLPDVRMELDKLIPESRAYYTYMGSLTTPPCTEGVLWIVMKTPVPISADQVAVFSRLYPMNARPIQQANGRFIKESM